MAVAMVVARLVRVTSVIKQRNRGLRSVCGVVAAVQTAGTSCASAKMRWRSSGLTSRVFSGGSVVCARED